jgi:hypothetical protein
MYYHVPMTAMSLQAAILYHPTASELQKNHRRNDNSRGYSPSWQANSHSSNQESENFMKPDGSLLCSQEPLILF